MADVAWPMWSRPASTSEVFPMHLEGPGGVITVFLVAVTPVTGPDPEPGDFVPMSTDGDQRGPEVGIAHGHGPGVWNAWAKVGTRVLPPIAFCLT